MCANRESESHDFFPWNWTEDVNDVIIWDTSRRTRISSFSFFGCTSWTWSCSLSAWFVVLASSTPLEEWAARRSSWTLTSKGPMIYLHFDHQGPPKITGISPILNLFRLVMNIKTYPSCFHLGGSWHQTFSFATCRICCASRRFGFTGSTCGRCW